MDNPIKVDLDNRLARMENDPRFKSMDYAEQQNQRQLLISKVLPKDARFNTLSPEQKFSTISKIAASRRPVFENQEISNRLGDAFTAAENGDLDPSVINTLSLGRGIFNESVVANMAVRPLFKMIDSSIPKDSLKYTPSIDALTGTDGDKVISYLRSKASQQKEMATGRAYETLGYIAGFVGDLAVFHGSWTKLTGKAITATSAKIAANTVGKTAWAARVAFPTFVSGTSGGAYGVFREQFLGMVNNDDERLQKSFKNVLKTFGEYAVIDYALGLTLGTVIPHIKTLKHLKTGQTSKAANKLTPKDYETLVLQLANGEPPAAVYNQLDDITRLQIDSEALLHKVAGKINDKIRLNIYEDLVYKAGKGDMRAIYNPVSGKYAIANLVEDADVIPIREFDDIIKARREVSKGLLAKYNKLPDDAAREAFLAETGSMMQYAKTENAIDNVFDATKGGGTLDPKVKNLLTPKHKAKGFISPVDRPYIGVGEADLYEKALKEELDKTGGFIGRFKVTTSDEMVANISKGKNPFQGSKAVNIMNGSGDTEAFIMIKYPATNQAIAKADELAAKAIANGAEDGAETLRNVYLMEAGFDGIVLDKNTVQMFYPDKLKFIANEFNAATGKIGKLNLESVAADPITSRAVIERSFTGKLSSKAFMANKQMLVDTAAQKFVGKLDLEDANAFTKVYFDGLGIDSSKVSIKLSKSVDHIGLDKSIRAYGTIKNGKAVIEIPGEISSPKAQKAFVREFFDELKNVAETLGKDVDTFVKKVPSGSSVSRLLTRSKAQFRVPFSTQKAQTAWLKDVVQSSNGSFISRASGYEVKFPKKAPIFAKDLEELTDKIMVSTLDEGFLKLDLSRQGFSLSRIEDQYILRGKSLTKPITANSIGELLDEVNYRPSKISNKYAPKVVQINEDSVDITFDAGVMIGNRASVRRALANFEDINKVAANKKIVSVEDGDIFIAPSGKMEVHMPQIGVVEEFSDIKAARKFIHGGWAKYDSIKKFADRKSLQMWFDKGVAKFSDGNTIHSATSTEEIGKILAKYPDVTGARNILEGLDPQSLTAMDKVLANFNTAQIPQLDNRLIKTYPDFVPVKKSKWGLRKEARILTQNMDYVMDKTMKELNRPDLLRKYKDIEVTARISQTKIVKAQQALEYSFTGKNGKLIDIKRRRAIFYHLGAQTEGEELKALEMFGELSAEEKMIGEKVRTLLGKDAFSGLANAFNVDPDLFLSNYMPRVMEWAAKNAKLLNKATTAEELFDMVYQSSRGTKAPSKLKAFFKNMRASDVLSFEAMDDPIKVLDTYIKVGYRQKYMGPAWEALQETMKKGDLPQSVTRRIHRYREHLMGVYSTEGRETAEQFGNVLAQKLGMNNGRELVSAYFSVNYLSNMGFRPWLAVRNSTQVWTTLAPRMGNEWVNKALKSVNEMGEDGYKYLIKIGLIQDAPPVVNQIMDADNLIGRLTHRGLAMFKRSDDITRAVAFNTATVRFDDAFSKLKRGVIKNTDDFLKEAGVLKMDDDTIREVRRLTKIGTDDAIEAARTKYGMQLSEDTMFGYRKSQAPMAFTGSFAGELFGQYGTYSAGYRANIYRGLSQGSTADKVGFAARFLGNQAALFGAFSALGIKAYNFIPGMPALFGGGPQWEVMVALMQSGATDYRGSQARAKLNRYFSPIGYNKTEGFKAQYPEMAPGNIQIRYAKKAWDYMQQGDIWKAFLAMTTTPVTDEDQFDFLR